MQSKIWFALTLSLALPSPTLAITLIPSEGITVEATLDFNNSETEVFLEIENLGTKQLVAIAVANNGLIGAEDPFPGSPIFGVGKWAAGVMERTAWDASRLTLQSNLQLLVPGLEVVPFDEAFPGGYTRAALYYAEGLLPTDARETIAGLPWAKNSFNFTLLNRLQPNELSGVLAPGQNAAFTFYTDAFGPPLVDSTSKFVAFTTEFQTLQGDTIEVIRNAPAVPLPASVMLFGSALLALVGKGVAAAAIR